MRVESLRDVVSVAAGAEFTAALRRDGTLWVFGSNWGKVAPEESLKTLVRPTAVPGRRWEGELQVRAGRIEVRDPTVERTWRGWTQRERTVRVVDGGIEIIDGGKAERQELHGRLVDVAVGWAIGWIEADSEAAGAVRRTLEQDRAAPISLPPGVERPEAQSPFVSAASPGATIAGGSFHSLRVRTDGTVRAWGYNADGELGDGTAIDRNSPVLVNGLTGVIAVAAGEIHTLALKSDGTVRAWGSNGSGQLGDGTTTDRAAPVQVNGLTGVTAIACGSGHSLALKGDGTVWVWGSIGATNLTAPAQVGGLTGVTAIASGLYHALVLKSDGTVRAWGLNDSGQLGDGTTTDQNAPVQVVGLTGVIGLAGGAYHSLALKSDGTVRGWGYNGDGELGDGTIDNRTAPVQVSGLTGVTAIVSGDFHSIALKSDGTVRAWGDNSTNQLGDGTSNPSATPVQVSGLTAIAGIASGGYHALAVKNDGTVWAWGELLRAVGRRHKERSGHACENQRVARSRTRRVQSIAGGVAAGFERQLCLGWAADRFLSRVGLAE